MTLYIVGTPIGNLGDISERGKKVLSEADYVACEDTRRTAILMNALGIRKPLISYYKQKENEGAEQILSLLKEGKKVALVSDAGMPVISEMTSSILFMRLIKTRCFNISVLPCACS